MFGIREQALELLEGGNYTATAIAGKLGVDRNAVSHAVLRSYRAGECRIVDYIRTGKDLAPVYGLGGGDDVERPAPLDPNDRSAAYRARNPGANRESSRAWRERNLEKVLAKQAAYRARRRADAAAANPVASVESCSQNPVSPPPRKPAVTETVLQYFELDGGLLPGVQHFVCDRYYNATLSTKSCSERWLIANEGSAEDRQDERRRACVACPLGALHAQKSDVSTSLWKGSKRCGRCHTGATRLIHQHLCVSCYNREREYLIGKNAKGTAPKMHPPLHRRSVSFLTDGAVKTMSIEHTIGLEEVLFSVLRTEVKTVKFGGINVPPAMRALRDNPDLDFSIVDEPGDEEMPGAHVVEDPQAAAPVADDADACRARRQARDGRISRPAGQSIRCDARGGRATRARRARVDADGVATCGKACEAAAASPGTRSAVTVDLLRRVGALPALAPVVVPAWQSSSSYSASLTSTG